MSTTAVTIAVAVFASTGFWSFLWNIVSSRQKAKTADSRLLLGLAYRSICQLCGSYIERGWLTKDEYEDLVKYLYQPYRDAGGDGTCERLMQEVDKLPIRKG